MCVVCVLSWPQQRLVAALQPNMGIAARLLQLAVTIGSVDLRFPTGYEIRGKLFSLFLSISNLISFYTENHATRPCGPPTA